MKYREGDIRDYIDRQRSAIKEKLKEQIEKFRRRLLISRYRKKFSKRIMFFEKEIILLFLS